MTAIPGDEDYRPEAVGDHTDRAETTLAIFNTDCRNSEHVLVAEHVRAEQKRDAMLLGVNRAICGVELNVHAGSYIHLKMPRKQTVYTPLANRSIASRLV